MKRSNKTASNIKINSKWGVIFVIGVISLVASFHLFNLVVPYVHDINVYLWAKAYHELVITGIWFPQWLPQMWYGFGLPVFYFYNPLFYWLAEILQLIGFNTIAAIKILLIATTFIGASFTYLWVKEYVSKIAALLAAALFVLSPYYLSLIYLRGAYPEVLALSLLPLLMWLTINQFKNPKKISYSVGITLTLATIILTHSLTAVLAGLLYVVYVLYLYSSEYSNKYILRISALAGVMSLAITAFYWLPVFANLDIANMSVLTGAKFYFGGNFPEIKALLNFTLIYRHGWITLGIIPIIILILGWLSQHEILSSKRRRNLLFFLIIASSFIFLVLPYSDFLWSWIPGLPIFQFPSRFLGPGILMIGMVGAMMLDLFIENLKAKKNVSLALIIFIIVLALPFIKNIKYTPVPNIDTSADLNVYTYVNKSTASSTELASGTVDRGIAAFEYLPRKLNEEESLGLFQVTSELFVDENDYTKISPPTKILIEEGDLSITTIKEDFYNMEYLLDAKSPSRIRINQFEFPAWQISLDEKPAKTEIILKEPGQFLNIPPGTHTLKLNLTSLTIYIWSRYLSLIALLVLLFWFIKFKGAKNTARITKYGKKGKNKKS